MYEICRKKDGIRPYTLNRFENSPPSTKQTCPELSILSAISDVQIFMRAKNV